MAHISNKILCENVIVKDLYRNAISQCLYAPILDNIVWFSVNTVEWRKLIRPRSRWLKLTNLLRTF